MLSGTLARTMHARAPPADWGAGLAHAEQADEVLEELLRVLLVRAGKNGFRFPGARDMRIDQAARVLDQ